MNKAIIAIIVVVVLLIGGYLIYQGMNTTNQQNNQTPVVENGNNPGEVQVGANVSDAKTYEVMYTDSGYSPATLTIKRGDTVNWKNQSSAGMWTASAAHPSHAVYSGTNLQQHCPYDANDSFDACQSAEPGQSWLFTFNKVGTWSYHNHMNSRHFGKIIVE